MAEYEAGRGPHFSQVPHDLLTDERTDSYHIAVYAALRSYCDFGSSNGAHPSDNSASQRAGCSSRTFRKKRTDLAELGWIDCESGKEDGAPNRYVVHGAKPAGPEGSATDAEGSARDADPGRREMPTTDNQDTESQHRGTWDDPDDWPAPSSLPKEGGDYVYPDEVEQAWSSRWDREGRHSKTQFYRNYRRRRQDGMSREEAARAVKNYTRHLKKTDRLGTRFAMRIASFFGQDEHWRDWKHAKRNGGKRRLTAREKAEARMERMQDD